MQVKVLDELDFFVVRLLFKHSQTYNVNLKTVSIKQLPAFLKTFYYFTIVAKAPHTFIDK